MAYSFSKYGADLNCFAVWQNGFTPEEVDMIIDLEKLQTFEKGKIGQDKNSDAPPEVRDSKVSWIHHDQHSDWLFSRLAGITARVNYDHFLYNIDGIEAFQYTIYEPGGHYTWHWDKEFGYNTWERKLSLTVCLSGPDEYEGGEFEIVNRGDITDPVSLKPNKGDIIYFSSWMPHRVAPITSGVRKSLVGWIMGKREC